MIKKYKKQLKRREKQGNVEKNIMIHKYVMHT